MKDFLELELELKHQKAMNTALGLAAPALLANTSLVGTEIQKMRELSELKRMSDPASAFLNAPQGWQTELTAQNHVLEALKAEKSATVLYKEIEEAKRLSAAHGLISAAVSVDTKGYSISELLKQQEAAHLQTTIADLLGTTNTAAIQALAASSVADSISADLVHSKWAWEHVAMKDQLASALAGLNAGPAGAVEGRIGVLSLKSVAALVMEERAGVAVRLNRPAFEQLAIVAAKGDLFEQMHKSAAASSLAALIDRVKLTDHFSAQMFADAKSTATLTERMREMTMPWLSVADEISSATAFSRLQAVGEILSHAAPYAPAVGSILRAGGLGDWREDVAFGDHQLNVAERSQLYVAHGADIQTVEPETKIFVPSAAIAGLFDEDENWDATWGDVAEDNEQLAIVAFQKLRKLERLLRTFIAGALADQFGPKWTKQRLPNGMLGNCVERQEKSRGGADYSDDVTAFMDFTDYSRVIDRTDNWKDVFQHVFCRREEIKESLQRLQPLRLATMHARSVSSFELLILLVESKRIAVAIQHWRSRQNTTRQ